ncbi:hypothetical protein QQ045_024233 [Rhodiola kirilowii]
MSSVTRNAIFNLANSFPKIPSIYLRSSPRVSRRVCFTTASKHSEGWNSATERWEGGGGDKAEEARKKATEAAGDAKGAFKDKMHQTKNDAHDLKDATKEKGYEMKEKTKEAAGSMSDKTKEASNRAAEKAEDMKETTKDKAHEMKESTKDMADKAKEGGNKTAEAVQNMGEKAKQTVQGAWEAAKDTTQKVKETLVGKDGEIEHKKTMEEQVDESIAELRRKQSDPDEFKK